jgi:hypothetical protein
MDSLTFRTLIDTFGGGHSDGAETPTSDSAEAKFDDVQSDASTDKEKGAGTGDEKVRACARPARLTAKGTPDCSGETHHRRCRSIRVRRVLDSCQRFVGLPTASVDHLHGGHATHGKVSYRTTSGAC